MEANDRTTCLEALAAFAWADGGVDELERSRIYNFLAGTSDLQESEIAHLLTLEKKIHGRWAGWPIPDACHTAENEKTRKRAG